jgi:spore germination protein KC
MRRILGIVLIFGILISLTACWNRRELNDLAITVALGFDKKGDKYQVTAQIVNPNEVAGQNKGGGMGTPTSVYTETADTIFEAVRKMTTKSPRKIYVAHLRMLVISEALAKEGIGKVLDIVSRDQEFRTDFFIVVTKEGSVEDILNTYTIPQEIIPANKMFKSLETASQAWAAVQKTTLNDLLSDILSEGKEATVTGVLLTKKHTKEVETKENVEHMKPLSSIQFQDMAVFKKDKLAGWLHEEEGKGLAIILGRVKNTVNAVSCPGGKLVLELIRIDREIKGKVVHGQPRIEIKVQSEERVADVECEIDLLKPHTIIELEKKREQHIKELMEKAIHAAQKQYQTDIFGFGNAIRRADPKAWQQVKKDWDQAFADIPVEMNVDVKIRRMGGINQSLPYEIKED